MENIDFDSKVQNILQYDDRYPAEAYDFVNAAVKYTIEKVEQAETGTRRHINAIELLNGMMAFARQEFGPLAWDVLCSWHLSQSRDVGCVVFNLVRENLFATSEEDSRHDFDIDYDFHERLSVPFRPSPADSRLEVPIIA